jgi:hypothetical protein
MDRSRTISLFAEVPAARRGPSGFLVSTLVHVAVMGLGYVYMKQAVRVQDLIANQRYNVRLINVESPQLRRMRSGGGGGGTPELPAAVMHAAGPAGQASPLIHEVERPVRAAQTLIQPDLPPNLLLTKQVPLPQVLIWSSGHTPAVTITPPPPLPVNAPIAHPSLETPNEQLRIAELKISASTFGASTLALPPSTTAPMVVRRAQQPMQMPAIASTSVGTATPARVISLSDVQLERGTIALPALNALGSADGLDDPTAEKGQAGSSGKGTGKQNASATGSGSGDRGNDASSAGDNGQRAAAGGGGQGGANGGVGHGAMNVGTSGSADGGIGGAGTADTASVTEIRQPIDGQFSAVVVGSSLAERYPETMELWAGRLAYTVYLHMGVQKNWILQYAATREAASAGGDETQPHAPWPYLMERPHLAPGDFNSDAVMVHGVLNTSGHFEALAVVFPSDFSQAQFVLSALRQWRFRPARQDGRIIAVEVLLIIPEEED